MSKTKKQILLEKDAVNAEEHSGAASATPATEQPSSENSPEYSESDAMGESADAPYVDSTSIAGSERPNDSIASRREQDYEEENLPVNAAAGRTCWQG